MTPRIHGMVARAIFRWGPVPKALDYSKSHHHHQDKTGDAKKFSWDYFELLSDYYIVELRQSVLVTMAEWSKAHTAKTSVLSSELFSTSTPPPPSGQPHPNNNLKINYLTRTYLLKKPPGPSLGCVRSSATGYCENSQSEEFLDLWNFPFSSLDFPIMWRMLMTPPIVSRWLLSWCHHKEQGVVCSNKPQEVRFSDRPAAGIMLVF